MNLFIDTFHDVYDAGASLQVPCDANDYTGLSRCKHNLWNIFGYEIIPVSICISFLWQWCGLRPSVLGQDRFHGSLSAVPYSHPPVAIEVKFCTAKFDVNRCNESPLWGEKTWFLACKFSNGSLPLRGILPVKIGLDLGLAGLMLCCETWSLCSSS